MKQKLRYVLGGALAMLATATMADELPTPAYFNDFSSAEGLTIVGNGVFEDDTDERFGKVFHNDPTLTKAIRTNWLEVPNVFAYSTQTKEVTIAFWVNKKNAEDYFWSPFFSAYGDNNVNMSHTWDSDNTMGWWPFFYVEARGIMQWNAGGWCDFTPEQNDNPNTDSGSPANNITTEWSNDGEWHYFTVTITTSSAKVYVDGTVINSWTIAENGLAGLFTQTDLTHFCLGGNQAFGWNDPDPAFAFDEFAVYNKALSADEIAAIISAKNNATGVQTVKTAKAENGTRYNLAGQKVGAGFKGITIENGKKTVVR